MSDMLNENSGAEESVLQTLRKQILHKQLESGAVLDAEALSQKLGVGADLVEEAIVALAEEGLVEVSPDGQQRVVVMTKRLAQELMDLLGLLLVSAVDRLPEDYERNAAIVAAAEQFSEAVLEGQENSEEIFKSFVKAIFTGTENGELMRVGLPVVERTTSIIRLYDSETLLPMWSEAFKELPRQLESSPKEAAQHLREFFVYLVNEIEHVNPLTAVPDNQDAGTASN